MTDHRQLGVDLFNETWRLIESREDDDADGRLRARIRLPLGARAGVQAREPRAQRVADLARLHRRRPPRRGALPRRPLLPALRALRARRLGPRLAYEALARASRVAGDREAVGQYVELAQAVEIADDGDRKQLEGDLKTLR